MLGNAIVKPSKIVKRNQIWKVIQELAIRLWKRSPERLYNLYITEHNRELLTETKRTRRHLVGKFHTNDGTHETNTSEGGIKKLESI